METNRNDEQGGVGAGAGGEPEAAANGPKRKNGRFTKGDPRIFKREKAAPQEEGAALEVEALPEEDGVPEQLLDMRHVYNRPAYHDKTHGQKRCRKWFDEDVKGFMSAKTQLEGKLLSKQEAEARKEEESGGDQQRDGGTETAIAAAMKFLEGFAEDEAAEDARLAARPDAAKIGATLQNALNGSLERERMLKAQIKDLRTTVAELKGESRPQ